MGSDTDWKSLRLDAESIRDHIQRWLTREGIPDPVVYIKETANDHPQPSKFTFVGSTGIDHETVELPSHVIAGSKLDLGLLAQGASEIMLAKLQKVSGQVN